MELKGIEILIFTMFVTIGNAVLYTLWCSLGYWIEGGRATKDKARKWDDYCNSMNRTKYTPKKRGDKI